jgi:hypothetical protein
VLTYGVRSNACYQLKSSISTCSVSAKVLVCCKEDHCNLANPRDSWKQSLCKISEYANCARFNRWKGMLSSYRCSILRSCRWYPGFVLKKRHNPYSDRAVFCFDLIFTASRINRKILFKYLFMLSSISTVIPCDQKQENPQCCN